MIEITNEKWREIQQDNSTTIIFVHTPFCATCQLAERMLQVMEEVDKSTIFYRMNASLFPTFMNQYQIESVPALLCFDHNQVVDKLYAFDSVTKLHGVLHEWKQMFSK